MKCESHLAIEAILLGLRRSGIIDRRAVQCIAETLREVAGKAKPHCADTAESLTSLAVTLEQGPARSCLSKVAA